MCFSGVEVVFGYGAQGILFVGCDGFQWVSVAAPAPQLDFNEHERLGSDIQTLTTPNLMFRALLTKDGTQRLVLTGSRAFASPTTSVRA